jgi:acylphosphatase
VQGVYYRFSMVHEAVRIGVTGWVRNRSDGSVEAVLEGEPEAVERLVELGRRGPGHAQVEQLDVADEEPAGLVGFKIG